MQLKPLCSTHQLCVLAGVLLVLLPWDPKKGLNSSQVIYPLNRPATPPPVETAQLQQEVVLYMPKNHRDVYYNVQSLRKSKTIQRDIVKFSIKMSKVFSGALSQQAFNQYTLHSQAARFSHLQDNKKRKRVSNDPNTRFSNIVDIHKAQQELENLPRKKTRETVKITAANDVTATVVTEFEVCQFEWQL